MGAQSFNEHVLQWLGRRHTVSDTFEAVDIIRNAGVINLSLDLIACVPNLSRSDWKNTLQQALALGPEHLSIYALADEEGTELRQSVLNGKFKMPKENEQLQALELAEDILTASGYARYEISNYAKSGFECRHHISCWRGEQYIGLGPAAASHIGIKRRANKPDLFLYIEATQNGQVPPHYEEVLSTDVERLDQIIFGLRMAEGISTELAFNYQDTFQALQAENLVVRQDSRWKLTNKGRNVADAVAVELMAN
jgi:oxygen-independent coproporphyrinogen-3 oxidase